MVFMDLLLNAMDFVPSRNEEENLCIHRRKKWICDVFSPEIPFISSTWSPSAIQKLEVVGADSFDWVLSYADDIYRYWRRIEQKRMIVKRFPDIFAFRTSAITIVRNLVTKCKMANSTLHLAVYIMDSFLSRRTIQVNELKLVTVTCFLIAAKVEDVETKMPPFAELNKTILEGALTLNDYKVLEAKILICLDFDVTLPTIATFGNFFSRISVALEDFFVYQQCLSYEPCTVFFLPAEGNVYAYFAKYEDMLAAINELAFRLIDLTLDSVQLINVLPSCKAAACIAAARLLYNIKPMWTVFLESQMEYSETEIRPFVEIIIDLYETNIINTLTSSNLVAAECCIPSIAETAEMQPIPYQRPFLAHEELSV